MRWTDTFEIAISLEQKYPDVDILSIKFTDLWQWIMALDTFDDARDRVNERMLEAIQMAWLDERS